MVNGNDVVEHEEKNCERLQLNFLEIKGFDIDNIDLADAEWWLESDEYWKFVEEDMNG